MPDKVTSSPGGSMVPPAIPGLEFFEEVGKGARNRVFRGRRRGRIVAVKIPRQPGEWASIDKEYRREASLLGQVPAAGLPAVYEVGRHQDLPFLITEFIEGQPLSELLRQGPLPHPQVSRLVGDVATTLAAIHARGLVHRDVKPANILITPSGQARLIDLGLSTRSHLHHDAAVTGTFRYSAPEQTGMLSRPLDGRADLYALGVVLFECLTGRPPYLEEDAAELIRLHAVAPLPNLAALAPQAPAALVDTVTRLLAKDPDDRFASAEQLVSQAATAPLRPRLLVGRDAELEFLEAHWAETQSGDGRLVMLVGEGGSGKSMLAADFASGIPGVPQVRGKCDAALTPFGLLHDLFEQASAQLELVGQATREQVMALVKAAAGRQAPLLAGFSPVLASLLPPQPQPTEVSHEHYHQALTGFLLALIGLRPIVALLDDLHWIDRSSNQVLRRLVDRLAGTRCMLLATSRDGLLEGIDLPSRFTTRLDPLNLEELEQLLTRTLGATPDPLLVSQVMLASNGSPFAAVGTIEAALEEGLFVPHWGGWRIEGEGLAELELPGDIIGNVVRRLDPLSLSQRAILEGAAVLGLRFATPLLCRVLECESSRIYPVLAEGIRLKLLEKVDSEGYRFVHDRVREALLSDLSPSDLKTFHRRAAQALEGNLFARAEHYWRSLDREVDGAVSLASSQAALLALRQFAHEESYEFFVRAEKCRPPDLEPGPQVEEAFGEACYRGARLDEALLHLGRALQSYQEPFRRAEVHHKVAWVHLVEMDTEKAWPAVEAALREIQLERCSGSLSRLAFVTWTLAIRTGRSRGPSDHEALALALRIYRVAAYACFLGNKIGELVEFVMRGLRLSRNLGPSPELALFSSFHATFLAAAGLRGPAARADARARQIAEQLGDPAVLAHTEVFRALCARCLGDDVRAATIMEDVLRHRGAWLTSFDYFIAVLDLTHNLHFRGLLDQAVVWAETGARRARNENLPIIITCTQGAVFSAVGRRAEARKQLELCRSQFETSESPLRRVAYLASTLHAALESGELGQAAEQLVNQFHAMGWHPLTTPLHPRSVFIVEAHMRYRQCQAGADKMEEFKAALWRLWIASYLPPYRAHYLVLQAGYQRLRGRLGASRRLLAQAEELAHRIHSPWVRMEVALQRAWMLREQENHPSATLEARLAANLASELGWVSQSYRIEREFNLDPHSSKHSSRDASSQSALMVRLQRNLEALLQVTLVSGGVLDASKLSQLVLKELARIVGAERAFLFLGEGPGLTFEIGMDSAGATLPAPRDYATTVVEQVAATRKTVLLSGTEEGRTLGSVSMVAHDLRSILAAPLTLRDRLLGVVYLDSRLARGVFGTDDVQVLQALANQIAVTLETARAARLEVQVRSEREQRLLAEQLGEMVGSMLSHLDSEQVLSRLLEGLARVVGFEAAYTMLLREGRLEPSVFRGNPRSRPEAPTAPQGIWARLLDGNRPLLDPEQSMAWISAPLRTSEDLLGTITLEREASHPFGRGDVELLHTFAGYASMAMENARLFSDVQRLATTDELTGLYNRRHFFQQASEEFQRADRLGHDLSVLMFDIDHFKKFNDTYGHAIGDIVIRTTAARCRGCFRSIDLVGRYGGEEFAVVLVGTALEPGRGTAERLRAAVADQPFPSDQGDLRVTISVGLAARQPRESLAAVLERADQALYRAKAGGRNRVEE